MSLMRLLCTATFALALGAMTTRADEPVRELVEREVTDKELEQLVKDHASAGIKSLVILESPALRDISYLTGLPALKSLKLEGVAIPELSRLNVLAEKLESLELDDLSAFKSLGELRLRNLRHLALRKVPLVDLAGLDRFPQLVSLTVEDAALTTLDGLAGVPLLERLRVVKGGTKPLACGALAGHAALTELHLADTPVDATFGPALAGLAALLRIHLTGCGLPTTFGRELAGLAALRHAVLDLPSAAAELGPVKTLLKCEVYARADAPFDAKVYAALAAHPSLKWLALSGPGLADAGVDTLGASKSLSRLDVPVDAGLSTATLARARTKLEANPRFVANPIAPHHVLAITDVGDRTLYAAPIVVVGHDGDLALVRANGNVVPPIEAIACDVARGKILWRKNLDPADQPRLIGQIAVLRFEGQRAPTLVRAATGEALATVEGSLAHDGKHLVVWETSQVTVYDTKTTKVLWKRPRDVLGWPVPVPTVVAEGVAVFLDTKEVRGFDLKTKKLKWQIAAPKVKDHFNDAFRRGAGEWVANEKAFYVLADRTFVPSFDGVPAGYQQVHAVVLATGEMFSRPLIDETTLKSMVARRISRFGEWILVAVDATGDGGTVFHRYDLYDFLLEAKCQLPWSRYRQLALVGKQNLMLHDSEGPELAGVCTIRGKTVGQAKGRVLVTASRAHAHPILDLGACSGVCRAVHDKGRTLEVFEAEATGPAFCCPPELETAAYFNAAPTDDAFVYVDERALVVVDPATMKAELEYPLPGGRLAQAYRAGPRWLITDTLGRLTILAPGTSISGK